jgi:hypothetical protein
MVHFSGETSWNRAGVSEKSYSRNLRLSLDYKDALNIEKTIPTQRNSPLPALISNQPLDKIFDDIPGGSSDFIPHH